MKINKLLKFALTFAVVLFAYNFANAQEQEPVKDTASKIKVVVTDALEKTVDVAKDVADTTKKTAKSFGRHAVEVTEGVVGKAQEQGRYYTVKTWDGTKWVSKQVFFAAKKTAAKVEKAVDQ